MKKLLISLLTVIVFSFCLGIFASATEVTETPEQTIETPSTESATESATPSTVEENASKVVDYVISVLTSPSFWAATASIVTGAIPIIVIVVKNLNNVTKLINNKADAKTIKNEIQSGVTEINNQFVVTTAALNERMNKMEYALESEN